jgi:Uma2 family endonuclease
MATGSLVSVHEYLSTSYRPDCDYVDGVVLERNVGENDHSRLMGEILFYYRSRRPQWGLWPFVSLRVQVSATRVRVPDVCVVLGDPTEQVLQTPPFICIEVLSKDDRLSDMQDRVADYLNFGVRYVWVIDPRTRKAWRCTMGGISEVSELRTEDPETVVPLDALFDRD